MGLTKYKLGELIQYQDTRNTDGSFTEADVRGISNTKELMPTKADMNGRSLDSFKIVYPGDFVYNRRTTRMGDKFAITLNNGDSPIIVTDDYIVFRVLKREQLLNEWLFMYFNRHEFDKYVRFNSWGSATEMFVWESMCDVDIELPDIEIQRKYVDVYLSLQNNLEAYQSKIDDLKLVCDGYIDQLKKNNSPERIGDYIEQCDERNSENIYTLNDLRGISIQKKFIDTKADMMDVSLTTYAIVKPEYFAFVPVTSRNGEKITLAYNDSDNTYIVSSAYVVFKLIDSELLNPDYLFMFFNRPEFDRYARFHSWGSAREVFSMEDLNDVAIPIPDISVQREIVKIHKCYIERQRIANQLKEQLNNLCPILVRGSLQTNN